MELNDIKELIDKINQSDIAYFEVKLGDGFIKMDKSLTRNYNQVLDKSKQENIVEAIDNRATAINEELKEKDTNKVMGTDNKDDENITIIKSPIVGSFYASASPENPPFVEVGTRVKKGQVLCIIEAMKLMNEIESDVDGEVVEIMLKNQELAEYGVALFKIRRS